MFGLADLIGVAVIDDGLAYLRQNPHHLTFILSKYENPLLRKYIGPDYIAKAVKLFTTTKIPVVPYNQLNMQQTPRVIVGAQYAEDTQFIGDSGGSSQLSNRINQPTVYATFDVLEIGDKEVKVAKSYNLTETIWPSLYAVNGAFSSQIDSIIPFDDYDLVVLTNDIPSGTSMSQWKAQTLASAVTVDLGTSIDKVTLQIMLTTSGSMENHWLYALILRYALKRGRLLFDSLGIQNTIIGQSLPVISDDSNIVVQSVFSVNGVMADYWIAREYKPVNRVTFSGCEPKRESDI